MIKGGEPVSEERINQLRIEFDKIIFSYEKV